MANNRMYLVCNVCNPVDEEGQWDENGIHAIAKWYPGSIGEEGAPYYSNYGGEKWYDDFMDFLDKHKHGELASWHYTAGAGQPNPVRLEYESVDLPKLP